jgi:chromosome segregation ATPase
MPPIPSNNSNPYGSVGGLYPSAEMNAYAAAMARAATARALFHLADSELSQAYRAAQKAFDNSAEYRQALREEKDAYENLNGARAKALSTLSSDDKYQRLAALRQDLTERLDDLRSRRGMSQQEIIAMANLKMSYSTEMRSFETVALNNEPAVKQAQDRLVAAGQHVSELRQRYSDSLRVNPEILVARRNLDDARIAKLTAEAYLHAAMTNGSYALDYAYYLYRRPSNNYYGGGYYGGDYSYTGGNYRY